MFNDQCYFSSRDNYYKVIKDFYNNYGDFYDDDIKYYWTSEVQLLLTILKNNCYFLDYLQNDTYQRGQEIFFDK